ncbi:unnamed protein product [Arabidopsis lyrata]|nr:unnamed protein product [Arabidopsis lyrata]
MMPFIHIPRKRARQKQVWKESIILDWLSITLHGILI